MPQATGVIVRSRDLTGVIDPGRLSVGGAGNVDFHEAPVSVAQEAMLVRRVRNRPGGKSYNLAVHIDRFGKRLRQSWRIKFRNLAVTPTKKSVHDSARIEIPTRDGPVLIDACPNGPLVFALAGVGRVKGNEPGSLRT